MIENNTLDTSGDEYRHLYQTYLRKGQNGLTDAETRALSIGAATGGQVLAPSSWSDYVQNQMQNDAILKRVNIVQTTTGFTQPIFVTNPTVNAAVSEASLGTESYTGSNFVVNPKFANTSRAFALKKFTAWATVSNELLEDTEAAQSVEEFLKRQLTASILSTINQQIVRGNGSSSQLQGSWQAAIDYSRTKAANASGNTTAHIWLAMTDAGAGNESNIDPVTFSRCVIVFNTRTGDKYSYGAGTPLDGMNFSAEGGLTTFGRPVVYMRLSDATGTGATLMHIFDPSQYLLATNLSGMTVTRLSERYADSNQTAFVASIRADGNILNTQAVFNITQG